MNVSQKLKRKLIQIVAFGFTNSHISGFMSGKIYRGKWKQFCNPGLNCYSCPAAVTACPVGAMQAVSGSADMDLSFYAVGFILALGVIFGRAICGYICPFGLIQELLAKIPLHKFSLPKPFTYVKYFLLVIFVIIMPIAVTNYMGIGQPAFCQYICPAGTLEGGLPLMGMHAELRHAAGLLFVVKAAILTGTLIGCMMCFRFFCKVMCPLGAVYGILNKISFYNLKIDMDKCVHCGKCAQICRMDVDPVKSPASAECIRCGECAACCPEKAIHLGFKDKG